MTTEAGMVLRGMDDVERLARVAVASGLVQVRRPEEAVVLLLTGHELGLSPMQSLRGIYVVSGRPVLSADLMVAVVRRSGLCASWRVVESTAEACTIETQRMGQEPARKTWTMADAKRAQVTGKGTWSQYPAQMLRHRCAADLARQEYSDVLMGLYDPDELDGVRGESEPARIDAPSMDRIAAAVTRDDAPAQLAAPDALAAFRADLDAAESLDLDGARRIYGAHDLGGTSLAAVTTAIVGALAARGYRLTATEAGQLLRGEMPEALVLAYDRLAAVDRHADDEEAPAPDAPPPAAHGPGAHWAYTGAEGPSHWGELDEQYATCGEGHEQSPIDILPKRRDAEDESVFFIYKPTAAKVTDTGHTLQVDLQPGSYAIIDGARYELVQLHVHTPSEHTIAGEPYAMEVHLVHQSKAGKLAVVGVLFADGAPSAALAPVWKQLPKAGGASALKKPFDPTALLPADSGMYRYAGSLTTPPCSEGVKWIVLRRTATDAAARIGAFQARFGATARPTQSLGEREVD